MKKLRVLLVDDEIMIREGFKRLFDWEGHDCQVVGEAADGLEALSRIDTLTPDIVIMDINIPIMNGLKVIQLARMKHPETAFVIVSGYDDFAYRREALRLQITDYILKPVNYDEFGACIDNLKIALFRSHTSQPGQPREERPIQAITRYLQEHLDRDISLSLQPEDNYGVEGMCLGMCLGAAIGTALDNNTGLGISLGMLVGLALGLCTHKRPEKAGK